MGTKNNKPNPGKSLPKKAPKEKVNPTHKDPAHKKDPLKQPGQKSTGDYGLDAVDPTHGPKTPKDKPDGHPADR